MKDCLSRSGTGPYAEILRRIGLKGVITFAEFMEVALYWHDGGYYASGRRRWGEKGDYITSIDISPVFSRVIAKTVLETWVCLGRPEAFELIEAGAGRGWLSKGIDEALKDLCPELHEAVKIRLVEQNPLLRESDSRRFTWHHDISELERASAGCVISNELIDSFPAHRVVEENGLKEIYVGFEAESLVEKHGEPSTAELEDYLKDAGVSLSSGQKAEINLKAKEWIGKASCLIDSGFVITIDYGLPARELYAPERMEGTLLCHYRHTLNDNPYVNIGEQDITTHVDFTSLVLAGRSAGLELTGFTTQKNFLLGQGILEEMSRAGGYDIMNHGKIEHNRSVARLITPGGAGDAFKVLIQHKGFLSVKPGLGCLSFRDMSSFL